MGEHPRRRRAELGLLQREVGARLGVGNEIVANWELDRTEPGIRYWPAIIAFLGYDPNPPTTPAERFVARRRQVGLTQAEMARRLGVDPGTLGRWERGETPPRPFALEEVHALTGSVST